MRLGRVAGVVLVGSMLVAALAVATEVPSAAAVGPASVTTERCYDQLTQDTGLSNVSDKYEPEFHVYDSRAADDVFLTQRCRVRSIDVVGTFYDGVGPAESETIVFYVDGGGTPGKRIDKQTVIGTYVFGGGSFHMILNDPVVLRPGSYWLSVRANMIFQESGQWGWNSIDHQVGAPAMWKNALDGFGTGCTTYDLMWKCFNGDPQDYLGLGFALNTTRK